MLSKFNCNTVGWNTVPFIFENTAQYDYFDTTHNGIQIFVCQAVLKLLSKNM